MHLDGTKLPASERQCFVEKRSNLPLVLEGVEFASLVTKTNGTKPHPRLLEKWFQISDPRRKNPCCCGKTGRDIPGPRSPGLLSGCLVRRRVIGVFLGQQPQVIGQEGKGLIVKEQELDEESTLFNGMYERIVLNPTHFAGVTADAVEY